MAKLSPVILVMKFAVFCLAFSLAVYVVLTSASAEATPAPLNFLCESPQTDISKFIGLNLSLPETEHAH